MPFEPLRELHLFAGIGGAFWADYYLATSRSAPSRLMSIAAAYCGHEWLKARYQTFICMATSGHLTDAHGVVLLTSWPAGGPVRI